MQGKMYMWCIHMTSFKTTLYKEICTLCRSYLFLEQYHQMPASKQAPIYASYLLTAVNVLGPQSTVWKTSPSQVVFHQKFLTLLTDFPQHPDHSLVQLPLCTNSQQKKPHISWGQVSRCVSLGIPLHWMSDQELLEKIFLHCQTRNLSEILMNQRNLPYDLQWW